MKIGRQRQNLQGFCKCAFVLSFHKKMSNWIKLFKNKWIFIQYIKQYSCLYKRMLPLLLLFLLNDKLSPIQCSKILSFSFCVAATQENLFKWLNSWNESPLLYIESWSTLMLVDNAAIPLTDSLLNSCQWAVSKSQRSHFTMYWKLDQVQLWPSGCF